MQSFAETDALIPQEANAIGLELAQREFPDFEVVVATHLDTNHIHNHLVVNSVSCETGRKLHQSADDLVRHRQANDEICAPWPECFGAAREALKEKADEARRVPGWPAPPTWTDNKQRRREAPKKLAMGQKLTADTHSQGMSM